MDRQGMQPTLIRVRRSILLDGPRSVTALRIIGVLDGGHARRQERIIEFFNLSTCETKHAKRIVMIRLVVPNIENTVRAGKARREATKELDDQIMAVIRAPA